MNEESCGFHLILSVAIDSTNLQKQLQNKGKLSFADLAGSENVKKYGVCGDGMKEAQGVNKSLYFGLCYYGFVKGSCQTEENYSANSSRLQRQRIMQGSIV